MSSKELYQTIFHVTYTSIHEFRSICVFVQHSPIKKQFRMNTRTMSLIIHTVKLAALRLVTLFMCLLTEVGGLQEI